MKKLMLRPKHFIIVFLLLTSFFSFNGCGVPEKQDNSGSQGATLLTQTTLPSLESSNNVTGKITSPSSTQYGIQISFPNGAPALNKTAELKVVFSIQEVCDNLTVRLTLPEGFQQVGGDVFPWRGALPEGGSEKAKLTGITTATLELTAIVKAIKVGNWTISTGGKIDIFPGPAASMVVLVSETTAVWTTAWFNPPEFQVEYAPDQGVPFKTSLTISNAPALNQTAELHFILEVRQTALPEHLKNVTITARLYPVRPENTDGLIMISGNPSWTGDIAPNSKVDLTWIVKALKTGEQIADVLVTYQTAPSWMKVNGNVYPLRPQMINAGDGKITIQVGESSSKLISQQLTSPGGTSNITVIKMPQSRDQPVLKKPDTGFRASSSNSSLETPLSYRLTINGSFKSYISNNEYPYIRITPRPDEQWPAVGTSLDIYVYPYTDPVTTGEVDANGNFSVNVYPDNPEEDVFFYVKFKTSGPACNVTDNSGNNYFVRYPMQEDTYIQASYDWSEIYLEPVSVPSNDETKKGAWRIFQTISNDFYDRGAYDFVKNEAQIEYDPPQATIVYPHTDPDHRPYYKSGIIYIHDEYDSYQTKALDTVQHEYAHFIMDSLGLMPYSYSEQFHNLNQNSDYGVAWVEGWAEFLPLVIQYNAIDPQAPYVYETGNSNLEGQDGPLKYNLEAATWDYNSPSPYLARWDEGDSVEGRIAGTLWDILDNYPYNSDSWDIYHELFLYIWNTFSYYPYNNFFEFYTYWWQTGHSRVEFQNCSYQNTIINFDDDVISLSHALDTETTQLQWYTDGHSQWYPEKHETYFGSDAAQSGFVNNNENTFIYTNVEGPGTIKFWWRVSSETNDYLKFYIDSNEQNPPIHGESGWLYREVPVSSGSHTLMWKYIKNGTNSGGWDTGWVDKVEWIPTAADKIGVYGPSTGSWMLDLNGNGTWDGTGVGADKLYYYGSAGDITVTGDWDEDGITEIGVYTPSIGTWLLDYNGNGTWDGTGVGGDKLYTFGASYDIPVTGDWNGDGITEIGLYRPSIGTWIIDYNGNGIWDGTGNGDILFTFGISTDIPVTGDWNGDIITEIGIYRPSAGAWALDFNGNGQWDGTGVGADILYFFGISTDIPVTGNW